MAHIRVGMRRTGDPPYELDHSPQWVEIDGVRLPDSAMIVAIEHRAKPNEFGTVAITMDCGGYETVPADV